MTGPALAEYAPHNAMEDAGEIARFHDRCSDLMRELLDGLARVPDRPRPFPEVEAQIGWPRRRIASVLGGVAHLRVTEFEGLRPYRFKAPREAASGRWEIWVDAAQADALRAARAGTAADAGGVRNVLGVADAAARRRDARMSGRSAAGAG
jgi:hypothetical protein